MFDVHDLFGIEVRLGAFSSGERPYGCLPAQPFGDHSWLQCLQSLQVLSSDDSGCCQQSLPELSSGRPWLHANRACTFVLIPPKLCRGSAEAHVWSVLRSCQGHEWDDDIATCTVGCHPHQSGSLQRCRMSLREVQEDSSC